MDVFGDIGHKYSPKVHELVNFGESHSMFHLCQESSAMLSEHGRRSLACHNQKRRSEYNRAKFYFQHIPHALPRHPILRKIRLTIEIQHGDFSSLLGQREAWSLNDTVAEIMNDTNCMIQFSDQRSAYAFGNVNNQVIITGDFPNIDEAQRRLRALSPLTIAVSLKNVKEEYSGKNLTAYLSKWLSENGELAKFLNIQFNIVQLPQWLIQFQHKGPFMVIRGSFGDHDSILKASEKLMSLLFDPHVNEEFCARLEIPVLHRRWIVGSPDGILMRTISMLSNCTIHFPVSSKGQAATSYFLIGDAKAVVSATRMFHDISPVRMEFDVENDQLARPFLIHQEKKREYDQFDTEHNVIVTVRKSQFEGEFRLEGETFRHTISLMTSEENINSLYAVRRKLLCDRFWANEKASLNRCMHRPRFIEYLRILITEASAKKAYKILHNNQQQTANNNNNNYGGINYSKSSGYFRPGSTNGQNRHNNQNHQQQQLSGSLKTTFGNNGLIKNYRQFCNNKK